MRLLISLSVFFTLFLSLNTKAQKYRLKTFTHQINLSDSASLMDSTVYYYKDGYGAILSSENFNGLFDEYHYNGTQKAIHGLTYDSAHRFIVIDSSKNVSVTWTRRFFQKMDSLNNITSFQWYYYHYTNQWWGLPADTYSYNGNKLITDRNSRYVYDATGRLDSIITGNYFTKYTYNSNGSIAGIWDQGLGKYTYNYAAGGELISELHQMYDPGVANWIDRYNKIYTYSPSGDFFSTTLLRYDTSGTWVNDIKRDYWFNNDGKDSLRIYNFWRAGKWDTATRYRYAYMSTDLLSSVIIDKWNSGTQNWEFSADTFSSFEGHIFHFQYETFFPTSVKSMNVATAEMKMYPIPATDILNIETSFPDNAQIVACIFSTDGKLLRKWTYKQTPHHKYTIPLSDLRQGNYVLTLSDGGQPLSRIFSTY